MIHTHQGIWMQKNIWKENAPTAKPYVFALNFLQGLQSFKIP